MYFKVVFDRIPTEKIFSIGIIYISNISTHHNMTTISVYTAAKQQKLWSNYYLIKTMRSVQKVERTSFYGYYNNNFLFILLFLHRYSYCTKMFITERYVVCTRAHILQNKIHSSLRSKSKKKYIQKLNSFVVSTYDEYNIISR